MDDICPDMNYNKFARVRDIFLKYKIKPLLGVVPANTDEKLMGMRKQGSYKADELVWKEIKNLADSNGWQIALHGYHHNYSKMDGGLLNINQRSEFAGDSYMIQTEKIVAGKKILIEKGLDPIAFMAPAHSFDENTLKALNNCGIYIITDGKGVYPYKIGDILLMPVPLSMFWDLPFGIYTICLHANTMHEKDFVKLERFIRKNRNKCISFGEGIDLYNNDWNKYMIIMNKIMSSYMQFIYWGVLQFGRLRGKA